MIKIITILFIASSLLMGGMINAQMDYSAFDNISDRQLAKMFAEQMTRELNVPVTIDSATTLLNIYSFGTTIVLQKQINTDADVIKNWHHKLSFTSAMFQVETQAVCNAFLWRYFIFKRHITAQFNYIDQNYKPLFSYTIGVDECSHK